VTASTISSAIAWKSRPIDWFRVGVYLLALTYCLGVRACVAVLVWWLV